VRTARPAYLGWAERPPPPLPPHLDLLMTEPIRLSRRVVSELSCSRAEAERYIENGWVQVDGVVVEAPQFATPPEALVVVRQGPVPPAVEPATLLLHRRSFEGADRGEGAGSLLETDLALTAADQWQPPPPAPTPRPILARHLRGLREVIPLEPSAEGLVLLSQDPAFLRFATERGAGLEQEYVVEVTGVAHAGLAKSLDDLSAAGEHEGRRVAACKVSRQSEARLRFAFPGRGPRPGELDARLAAVGLRAVWSRRLRIGRLTLAKLPAGQFRYVDTSERL
jgi:23S rRNA pseudouridine2604 synthase